MDLFKKVENLFLVLSLIIGFIFIAVNPLFAVPDENHHFYKMYSISEGSFNFKKITINEKIFSAAVIPKSFTIIEHSFFRNSLYSKERDKNTDKNIPLNKDKTVTYVYMPPSYGILSYMPGVLFLEVMKFFNMPPFYMVYVLRIVSLLTYVSVIYFAIKLTPIKKHLFMLCGLVPTALYLAGGISTDGLIISLCYLYTAYVFNLAFNDKVKILTAKDFLLIAFFLFFITVCKFPYAVLLFLLWIIPAEKFPLSKLKSVAGYAAGIFVLIFSYVLYYMHITKGLTPLLPYLFHTGKDMLTPFETMLYVLQNPMTVFTEFVDYSVKFWLSSFNGLIASFNWDKIHLPVYISFIYSLLLIANGFFKDKCEIPSNESSLSNKFVYLLIVVSFYVGVYLTCMLLFSDTDHKILLSVWERYLLPVLPIICLLFSAKIKVNYFGITVFNVVYPLFAVFAGVIVLYSVFYL